jgi:hypothetical protein
MATINHKTYNEATETFKDFNVYDGKETLIFKVDGEGGNVGIGTSSPTDTIGYGRALDIQSSTGAVVYLRDSNAPTTQYGFLAFDGSDNGLKLHNANSSGFLRFDTNATEKMRITSAGNVGIGTTTSSYDTNKIGSGHRFLNVQAGAGSYAVGTLAGNQSLNGDRLGYLTFVNDNNSASYKYSAWLGAEVDGTTTNQQGGRLIFSTMGDGSSAGPIERMRITQAGNVGIGNSSPTATLDVTGTLAVSGAATLSSSITASGIASLGIGETTELAFIGDRTTVNTRYIKFVRASALTDIVNIQGVNGGVGNTDIALQAGGGNVGIGTSSPTDNGLTFNGDTAAANALDDYEEGTWTPVMVGSTTAGTGTYDQQVGKYTKIGNVVRVNFSIQWTAHTGTGATVITGLPFASGAGVQTPFSVFTYGVTMTAGNVPNGGILSTGTSQWLFWQIPTGGGLSSGVPIYNGTAEIQVSGTYSV